MRIEDFLKQTLSEDIGRGDLFSKVDSKNPTTGKIFAKSEGVFSGRIYIEKLSEILGTEVKFNLLDGDEFKKGDVVLEISGDSHTILSAERTFLNIVLHSSSIATLTRKYVKKVEPFGVKILDTRKTRPLLRDFEKYSTLVGGAVNHRMGLDDSLMLKDTHLKTILNLDQFLEKARKNVPFTTKIEIEAETVEFAKDVLLKDIDILMCDNMTTDEVKEIVEFRNKNAKHITLEASGNINLKTVEKYAKTGVDAISVGSIIHQANWIDLSMKID
ncbi:nicotinate-nucleotide pyrophosphorylase [Thiovulum sp. ES]|nr:nicotinate-nucleotide pyrophosphorylase [Thiovulum sp. ES]